MKTARKIIFESLPYDSTVDIMNRYAIEIKSDYRGKIIGAILKSEKLSFLQNTELEEIIKIVNQASIY